MTSPHPVPDDEILAAQASQARYFVPSSVSIAQWALESAWGAHMPLNSFNPFGIKAKGDEPYVEAMTWEVVDGHNVRVSQKFAKYPSLAAGFEAHARLLATVSLYKPAMDAWYHDRSLDGGVRLMAQHYATDPSYATKIMAIITANDLVKYDSLPADRAKLAAAAAAGKAAPTASTVAPAPTATAAPYIPSPPVIAAAAKAPTPPPAAQDPLSTILAEVEAGIGAVIAPTASGPSPAPVSVPPATNESAPMTNATTAAAPQSAASIPVLGTVLDFLRGVSGKLETAHTMASSGSSIATGVIASLPEIPTIVGEISTLIVDVETGAWGLVPTAVIAIVEEFEKIAGKFGLDMSKLDAFVRSLPFQPPVAAKAA